MSGLISAVLIIPASLKDAADALAVSMGWAFGPGTYSVPLTDDGNNLTHYGAKPDVSQSFIDMVNAVQAGHTVEGVPPEAVFVVKALIMDADPKADRKTHLEQVLAREGMVQYANS